jgi:hypothetical protein
MKAELPRTPRASSPCGSLLRFAVRLVSTLPAGASAAQHGREFVRRWYSRGRWGRKHRDTRASTPLCTFLSAGFAALVLDIKFRIDPFGGKCCGELILGAIFSLFVESLRLHPPPIRICIHPQFLFLRDEADTLHSPLFSSNVFSIVFLRERQFLVCGKLFSSRRNFPLGFQC